MLKESDLKSVLIIGISGGLAQITSKILSDKFPNLDITGVDSRNTDHIKHLNGVNYKTMNYTRGNFEKLFRSKNFDVVFHLARMSHAISSDFNNMAKRLDLSVMGTNKILDLSLAHQVKKIVILSTFHVYGAYPDNPVFLKENAPLRASVKYPDLRDVVEMDLISTNWMWKHQNNIETVVLRPCNIIGAQIRNTMSSFLSSRYAIRPLDFNPTFQFMHEYDMAHVLVRSLLELPTGIFNVAPDETITIRKALDSGGNQGVPMVVSLLSPLTKFLRGLGSPIPEYLIDYLKFSCLVDNSQLKRHLGEDFCRFTTNDALSLVKLL